MKRWHVDRYSGIELQVMHISISRPEISKDVELMDGGFEGVGSSELSALCMTSMSRPSQ